MEAVKKKLQAELDSLEEELHFKLPKEIQKAREFGDLQRERRIQSGNGKAVDRPGSYYAGS